jgi:hypothetical protein
LTSYNIKGDNEEFNGWIKDY